MKAVICTKFGSPEVLKLAEVETPKPKDDEILIKIHSTTVTSGDARLRALKVPLSFKIVMRPILGFSKPRSPILGSEIAGEVVAIGKDVTKFNVGDKVFAMTGFGAGGYAEYKALPESGAIAFIPDNLHYEEVAIAFGGTTALHFLRRGNIQHGQKVLVYGASGAVGTYAVQLAKHFGAEVIGVCSTKNIEMVLALGADQVIDYTEEDFTQNSEKYDIIFDTVGKTTFSRCKNSLTPGGIYMQANGGLLDLMRPMWNKQFVSDVAPEKAEDLDLLKELIEAGSVKPVIDRCYPLEEIVEAHRYVDSGRKCGNVIITVA